MNRLPLLAGAMALALGLSPAPVSAAPPSNISMSVGVCSPWSPSKCAQPDSSGNLPVSVSGGNVGIDPAHNGVFDSQLDADLLAFKATQLAPGPAVKAQSNPVTRATDDGEATANAVANISTATTTKIISASGSTATYISHLDFLAAGADNVTVEYGTGTNCGTGTTAASPLYPVGSNGGGISIGSGGWPVIFIPASKDTCILTSAAVVVGVNASYAQY